MVDHSSRLTLAWQFVRIVMAGKFRRSTPLDQMKPGRCVNNIAQLPNFQRIRCFLKLFLHHAQPKISTGNTQLEYPGIDSSGYTHRSPPLSALLQSEYSNARASIVAVPSRILSLYPEIISKAFSLDRVTGCCLSINSCIPKFVGWMYLFTCDWVS